MISAQIPDSPPARSPSSKTKALATEGDSLCFLVTVTILAPFSVPACGHWFLPPHPILDTAVSFSGDLWDTVLYNKANLEGKKNALA